MTKKKTDPIIVIKAGEPIPFSDEINKALEKGKLYQQGFDDAMRRIKGEWERGFIDALDKAFSKFDANCTYSGDRVLQILEKLKDEKGGAE